METAITLAAAFGLGLLAGWPIRWMIDRARRWARAVGAGNGRPAPTLTPGLAGAGRDEIDLEHVKIQLAAYRLERAVAQAELRQLRAQLLQQRLTDAEAERPRAQQGDQKATKEELGRLRRQVVEFREAATLSQLNERLARPAKKPTT